MTCRGGRWVLAGVLGTVLLITAHLLISTTFMIYDDEGYVLQTYRDFANGHRLYDDIFSQYGPWPYVYHLVVGLLAGEPMTHVIGRGLTAVHWVLSALFAGALTLRFTRNLATGVSASLLSFGLLWQMAWEPSHPGGLIAVILAASVTVAVVAVDTGRWKTLAATLGTVSGLLVFTKINVGFLFVAGAGATALRYTAWPSRWTRPALIVATVGLLVLPWALMAARLNEPRVLMFAVQFTLCAAGLLWVSPVNVEQRLIPGRVWIIGTACFVAAMMAVATVVCAKGTAFTTLIRAVFAEPLRHPTHFFVGMRWSPWIWPVSLVCSALVARAGWEWRARRTLSVPTESAVHALRLTALGTLAFHTVTWVTVGGPLGFITCCLPLLPVFLIPLPHDGTTENPVRPALTIAAIIALPQVLHAYPVAGSQVGWGTFLLQAIMLVGLYETWSSLAARYPQTRAWLPRGGVVVVLAIGCIQLGLLLQTGWERYHTSKPMDLPGGENIRPDGRTRLALRTLTINAAIHGDMLFSSPGMFSYNQWSGVPTPTHKNATHWSWLLNQKDQEKIVGQMIRTPRSVLISNHNLEVFITDHVAVEGSPTAFVKQYYRPLFSVGDFTFHVRLDSKALPFGLATVFVAGPGAPQGTPPVLLQANVALNGQPARVQVQGIEHPWPTLVTYTPADARIVLEPITSEGQSVGPAISLPHAQQLHGLFRLRIYTDRPFAPAKPAELELVVLDPSGATLAEAGVEPSASAGH